MKRNFYILGIIFTLFGFGAKAQITLTTASSCLADTLNASLTGLTPVSAGITFDDGWSSVIPIGFSYTFYGNTYTQCIIGSNGEIGFDVSYASAYNTWPISATLLSTTSTDMHNLIAGPWCDIYIPAGGTIMYSTVGTAPNRKFECTWCGTAMYSCTTQWVTTQIIIYETTGLAEVHIGHHTFCTSWNGGYAEVGVKNNAGTAATVAPGRDYPSNWNATNEGWRFTPVGTTSYTCTSIPYAPIPYAATTVYWYDSTTHTYLGTGLSLIVTPSVTTTYEACALGCNDTTKAFITVGPVGTGSIGGGIPHISAVTFTNPTDCGLTDGTITLHGIKPFQIDSVFETIGGVPVPVFVTSAGADSLITLTGFGIGTYTFYVKVGPCPSNTVTVTLTTPTLLISGETFSNPTLCGKCDGSITLHGLWPGATATITYNFDGAPQTYTGTVAPDSSITLSGLCIRFPSSNFTSFVAAIGLCTAVGTDITLTSPTINDYGVSPTLCGNKDGYIKLYNLPSGALANVTFGGTGGALYSPISATVDGTDTLTLPFLSGGTYTSIIAAINLSNCPASDITLIDPPINASYISPSICGIDSGKIMLYNLPAGSTFQITFGTTVTTTTFSNGTTSGMSFTVAGNDTLTIPNLIAGTYSSIVATIGVINCPLAGPITLIDPPVHAQFDTLVHLGCRGDNVVFKSTSLPIGYHNAWTFGDGTPTYTTDLGTTSHLYMDYPADSGTYVAVLMYNTFAYDPNCYSYDTMIINFNHPIAAAYTPVDTMVCLRPASPITFINNSYGTGLTYAWDFGDGLSATDLSPTHAYANGGVYQTKLTVTDYLGCDSTVYGSVDVIRIDIKTVTHDTTVCLVEPMEMIAHPIYVPGTFTSIAYEWTPGINLNIYNDTIAYFMAVGDFIYTITATTTPLGCTATDTETIHSMPPLVLTNVTASQTIIYGNSVQLNCDGADYYIWLPADGTLSNNNINNPVATPLDSTTYTVYGMNEYGCKSSATVTITLNDGMCAFIPSGFTPNGDGRNDKFRVSNLRYQKLVDMKVFNRWGVELFHTTNGADGWDGTYQGEPQDLGTYTYVIILAQPGQQDNKVYTGMVTLLR